MPQTDLVLPPPHAAQQRIENCAARFNVMNCGRRFGKDILGQRRIARKAIIRRQPVAWFAPSYRMLLENWRHLRNMLAPVTLRASDSEHRIDLVTGYPLEMWSLDNHDAARGRKYGYVFINEAAMVKDLMDAWNMVIRPTLADYRGGADFGSTPRGLNGFHELWKLAADRDDWARFHYTTYDNPHIPREEIDELKRVLPERVFQQEIMAEFVEDGSFFQNVDAAAVIETQDMPEQHAGHYIVAGLDWALSQDFTVLTLACRDCNRVIAWDRFNQLDYTYQRERVAAMCRRYQVGALLPERNSIGEPNIEILVQMGLPIARGMDNAPGFSTTAATKPALIQKLASGLEHDGFQVPRDYADELRSYEVETMASGHTKFSAPDGAHDDRVISLALAYWAMTSAGWLIAGRY